MVTYEENTAFALARDEVLAHLHPKRRRILKVRVFRLPHGPNAPSRDRVRSLVTHLGFNTAALDEFVTVDAATARQICLNISRHELAHLHTLLPRDLAENLTDDWMRALGNDVSFVTNGDVGMLPDLGAGAAPPLTFEDLDAGVIAVGKAVSGIFWNSENS